MSLPYPRVRVRGKGRGGEVTLPSIEALRNGDPMTERVAEQIALGVSTRGYQRSLEPVDPSIETGGASKSNASRALIDATTERGWGVDLIADSVEYMVNAHCADALFCISNCDEITPACSWRACA